jgi:hypothetical protein
MAMFKLKISTVLNEPQWTTIHIVIHFNFVIWVIEVIVDLVAPTLIIDISNCRVLQLTLSFDELAQQFSMRTKIADCFMHDPSGVMSKIWDLNSHSKPTIKHVVEIKY